MLTHSARVPSMLKILRKPLSTGRLVLSSTKQLFRGWQLYQTGCWRKNKSTPWNMATKKDPKSKFQCFVDVNLLKSHLGLFHFYHQMRSEERSPTSGKVETNLHLRRIFCLSLWLSYQKNFFAHNSVLETLLELTKTIAKFFDTKILTTNFDRKQ